MLQDFTSDPDLLLGVAKNYRGSRSKAMRNATGGPSDEVFSPGALQGLPSSSALLAMVQAFIDNEYEFKLDERVRLTTHALQTLAQTLAILDARTSSGLLGSSL
jgi:hypothetical protein